MFDSKEYLSRVKLSRSDITLNVAGLRKLYLAHLHHFVFENIDCLLGNEIKIDLPSLFQKLIINQRGGYCFELNLFFLEALRFFGFKADVYLVRVFYRGTGINAKTHLTVIVELENVKYIVDAGFGGPGPEDLLLFKLDSVQKLFNYNFKIIEDSEFGYMIQRESEGIYKNVFAFKFEKVYPADIEMSNFYVSRLPTSAFLNNINICQFNARGRQTVFNANINNFDLQIFSSRPILDVDDFKKILTENFNVKLSTNDWEKLNQKFLEFKTR